MKFMAPGLYIHVPFCRKKCGYCDFFSITDLTYLKTYAESVMREISLVDCFPDPFDTVYIGGGTPSVLPMGLMADILNAVAARFTLEPQTEITLEANPKTVNTRLFREYLSLGINRIQIGAQSFQDRWLRFLGRIHTAQEAETAIRAARAAGFSNVGVDLMYGMPGQTVENLLKDLERLCWLEPEHISCYMLSCETGTPLDRSRQAGIIHMPGDETTAEQYLAVHDFLEKNGYQHYEISNFSRLTGKIPESPRSRHNQKYWARDPYLGVGPSAHSFLPPVRRWNVSDVALYVQMVSRSILPLQGEERLSRDQEIMEAVFLNLRRREGMSVAEWKNRYGVDLEPVVQSAIQDPFIRCRAEADGQRFRLNPMGMVVMDSIVSFLIDRLIPENRETS